MLLLPVLHIDHSASVGVGVDPPRDVDVVSTHTGDAEAWHPGLAGGFGHYLDEVTLTSTLGKTFKKNNAFNIHDIALT